MFPGDIAIATEREIIRTIEDAVKPTSIILKLAHHGSRYSTGEEWLNYFRPIGAVASVGGTNTYGHPHPDVLGRLKENESLLWRTDYDGEVVFRVTETGLLVENR